jgi:hypothetical protein
MGVLPAAGASRFELAGSPRACCSSNERYEAAGAPLRGHAGWLWQRLLGDPGRHQAPGAGPPPRTSGQGVSHAKYITLLQFRRCWRCQGRRAGCCRCPDLTGASSASSTARSTQEHGNKKGSTKRAYAIEMRASRLRLPRLWRHPHRDSRHAWKHPEKRVAGPR